MNHQEQLTALANSVNDTARAARNNISLLLVAAFYIAFTLSSATDENLLRNSTVALLQFQTGISLKLSYLFAPIVFLYLHLHALYLLIVLSRKVRTFESALSPSFSEKEKLLYRELLSGLSIVQRLYKSGYIGHLANSISIISVTVVPATLLVLVDISFLRFQSSAITTIHHVCVTVDFLVISLLHLHTRSTSSQLPTSHFVHKAVGTGARRILLLRLRFLRSLFTMVTVFFLGPTVLVVLWLQAWPPENQVHTCRPYCSLGDFVHPYNVFDYLCSISPWRGVCRYVDVSERILMRAGSDGVDVDPPNEAVGGRIERYRMQYGIDLSGRSLRFADFRNAWLPGALLIGADLRNVKMESANMNGADFSRAQMNEGVFCSAKMNYARLEGARMNGTNLHLSELKSADLQWSEMNGASLHRALLPQANLKGAEMNGADLGDADFSRAEMADVSIVGAVRVPSVKGANMWDIKWEISELPGAMYQMTAATRAVRSGLSRGDDEVIEMCNRGTIQCFLAKLPEYYDLEIQWNYLEGRVDLGDCIAPSARYSSDPNLPESSGDNLEEHLRSLSKRTSIRPNWLP